MKKQLLLITALFLAVVFKVSAQETVIFYPDFRYDSNRGFTKHNITVGSVESNLWSRTTNLAKLPEDAELGYTRNAEATSITAKGYDGVGDAYGVTDTYAVIDGVDLSAYPQHQDFQVTFFNLAEYGLANFSKFSVLISDNYTDDPTTTVWEDVTSQLDQIDDEVNYNGKWTKSTLNLNAWRGAANLVLAFRYQVLKAGVVDKETDVTPEVDRPGAWRVCEVRFTTTAKDLTPVAEWQFDNFNLFEMVDVVSTNTQGWKRTENLRTDLVEPQGEDYKSIQASAVYGNGSEKDVSPTEAWTVLNAVDFTGYSKAYLSFWGISQYKKGGDSELRIKMSTNYTINQADQLGALSAATWVDITDAFNLDESLGYDQTWVNSIGEVDVDPLNPNISFAFVYTCSDTYADVNGTNSSLRASTWKIGDIKASIDPKATSIAGEAIPESQAPLFYPNPAQDYLMLRNDVQQVELFNLGGQKVNVNYNGGSRVDVSYCSPGVYLVRMVLDSKEVKSSKVIIK
ncbi:T9SS type A sorting domain-containing protein [Carboxylicivirga sp. M1479]|uniref:T9SS type A sorting domain-containing protein n=1 Tax=Carboxylicivirga sp. M1479 TaxID=2594476 RepID=UPI001177EBCC|nr:T9SS type A sorting domain-containing protein [Carboxylicivirga sp. M1479]TRX71898.1 T9SS type A sorting domain-containing protein [Carboxylicivirga sp. M1479]